MNDKFQFERRIVSKDQKLDDLASETITLPRSETEQSPINSLQPPTPLAEARIDRPQTTEALRDPYSGATIGHPQQLEEPYRATILDRFVTFCADLIRQLVDFLLRLLKQKDDPNPTIINHSSLETSTDTKSEETELATGQLPCFDDDDNDKIRKPSKSY